MHLLSFLNPNKLTRFAIILFTFFFQITLSHATTYYVNNKHLLANNSNNGTAAQPWRTIQKAANSMSPGDTCIVSQGHYTERVIITTSGKLNSNIVYLAQDSPVINGFQINANNIEINGFEITSTSEVSGWGYETRSAGSGIFVEGKKCIISNNNIHDIPGIGIDIYAKEKDSASTSFCKVIENRIVRAALCGIYVQGKSHFIFKNDISHILKSPPNWTDKPAKMDADGIRFFGSGHHFKQNRIYDILLSEGNKGAHIDCFQTWGKAYDIIFEQNYCENTNHGMQGFMIEQLEKPVRNITFINNIIITQGGSINITNKDYQGDIPNINIYNNTFYGTGWFAITLKGCPNSNVFNNLFIDCGGHNRSYISFTKVSNLQIGYNSHYMTDRKKPGGKPFMNDIWQIDPKCKNIKNLDFHLEETSPLIDAGKQIEIVKDDYDGNTRPQGMSLDIGAYEMKNR